jgi:parallel beta-helix repeat protein
MRRTIVLLSTMALALLVASGVALAVAIGPAGADSSVVGPGESIQKAVNAADPGDTIIVRGVHREDVIIRKDGIKLRGEDAVIEAPRRAKADSFCSRIFGPTAICVLGHFDPETDEINKRVSDVSVSGFTIRGFNDKDPFVIFVGAARNATVVGNRIKGNGANGIALDGSVDTTIANNRVISGPETAEVGILVDFSSGTKILNNVARSYDLELPSIGWQLFILGTPQSDSTAFLQFLDTYATRLLTEPLRDGSWQEHEYHYRGERFHRQQVWPDPR